MTKWELFASLARDIGEAKSKQKVMEALEWNLNQWSCYGDEPQRDHEPPCPLPGPGTDVSQDGVLLQVQAREVALGQGVRVVRPVVVLSRLQESRGPPDAQTWDMVRATAFGQKD